MNVVVFIAKNCKPF